MTPRLRSASLLVCVQAFATAACAGSGADLPQARKASVTHTTEDAGPADAAPQSGAADVAAQTRDVAAQPLDTAAETPDSGVETSDTAAETSDTAAETPDTAAETPDTAAETSDTAAETPDTAAETPDTAAETSDTAAESPDIAAESPDIAAASLEIGPEIIATAPETLEAAPETFETTAEPVDAGASPLDAAGDPSDLGDPQPPLPTQPPVQAPVCSPASAGYAQPFKAGASTVWDMNELSGLAASRIVPGVLWSHNDSGDPARIFATTATGAYIGEYWATDVTATDWEDIGVGPCPAGECVFVGDIGDNTFIRTEYQIWRIAEPVVDLTAPPFVANVVADKIAFRYPGDAKYNSETLLIHPDTGEIYVITKWGAGKAGIVWHLPPPYVPGALHTMEQVGILDLATADSPMTAGSVHPCGDRVLLRTYGKLYRLDVPPNAPFEAVFAQAPVVLPVADELQGEAVTWRWDGQGYYTTSEGGWQPLWFCAAK